jgi:hypothetical protein
VLGGCASWQAGPAHNAGVAVETGFEPHPEFKSFKQIQTVSNFGRLERYFPGLGKIEIKYGSKEFETRNNFSYRNFPRFWMDFELNFREASMSWISLKIHWKIFELWNLMKFG